MKLVIWPLFLLLGFSLNAAEPMTYGDLYLVEDVFKYKHEAYLSYTNELDNSFENVSGVAFNYNYFLHKNFQVGVRVSTLNSSTSDTAKLFNSTSVQLVGPESSFGAVATFIPFRGHVNFLSKASLPFDLAMNASYGQYNYENKNGFYQNDGNYYSMGVRQTIEVYKDWFASLEVNHTVRTQRTDFDTSINSLHFGAGMRW